MDPMTMMMLASFASPMLSGFFGNKGGGGSTYNKGQRSFIDDILEKVQGMGGAGGFDINQNPQFQQGQEYLNSLFNDPDFFQKFEAPMQRQFEENIGDIGNRFAGMGTGGSTGSTGFRNAATREARNLSESMAALRGGMQQQGANQALQYGQMPFNNIMQLMGIGLTPTKNTYQQSSF